MPAPTATPDTLAMVGWGRLATARQQSADDLHLEQAVPVASAFPREIGARAELAPGTGDHDGTVVTTIGDLVTDRSE
ncbi:MAG: hypothetical protein WKF58_05995 [Ilumatobacteraceae bacterium]